MQTDLSTKSTESQIQKVILMIADISGYTRFMFSNQMDLAHSQWVISQFIQAIIKHVEIPLEVAKLEGDAVFLSAVKAGDDASVEEIKQKISEKLISFFEAFSDKIAELNQSNTCACNACQNIHKLKLKLVVHSGEALFYQIDKFFELSGPDVIIVHRLLKNSIKSDEYILLTEAAYQDLALPGNPETLKGQERYEGIGPITTYVHFPQIIEAYVSTTQANHLYSSTLHQLKTAINRHINLFMMDWRLKMRPQLKHGPAHADQETIQEENLARLFTLLRIALGLIFIIGGIKIGFPDDPLTLAASYTNPADGLISPLFAEKIISTCGISISLFLRIQGIFEIITGISMIRGGVNTRMVAGMMALMLWMFVVVNPVAGEIRLSRDIALAGLCLVVALTDLAGRKIDGKFTYRDHAMLMIRLSLAYTFLASALFSEGVFSNPLNSTLPLELIFLLGIFLVLGIFPRWVMLPVVLWMLYLLGASMLDSGIYAGLEALKREIGLLTASYVYFMAGPDRWAWPKRKARQALDS